MLRSVSYPGESAHIVLYCFSITTHLVIYSQCSLITVHATASVIVRIIWRSWPIVLFWCFCILATSAKSYSHRNRLNVSTAVQIHLLRFNQIRLDKLVCLDPAYCKESLETFCVFIYLFINMSYFLFITSPCLKWPGFWTPSRCCCRLSCYNLLIRLNELVFFLS